ncbi:MAG: hypothetical protein K0Q55_572 [Verrucomicrobia bacterium]|nr:hypothetical protein [Verrucomicrobiota bacterium]
MSNGTSNSPHKWRFYRAGGFDQVSLDTGADLLALDQLDQKLWVALACPAQGLEFDTKTLQLVDTDKDGRIRAPEILAAVKWAGTMLKNPDDLTKSAAALPLAAINDATPEGKQILASARQILKDLGKSTATVITVEDTADTAKIFAQTNFNGDGIIPADSASDDATKAVLQDIINCLGSLPDRSGKPGVDQVKVDQFFAELQAFSDWWKKAEGDQNILPLGDATPVAVTAMKAVKAKVEDYFARCRMAQYDIRALGALNRQEADFLALAAKDLTITAQEIASFPLSRVAPSQPLPLLENINPAWSAALAKFQADVVKPLLGDQKTISEADWNTITGKLAVYEVWAGSKAGLLVEKLGLSRVREILATNAKGAITQLIAQDKALEPEVNTIASVDRLIRYHRDLYTLLNNFVTFRDFYGRKKKAIFQVGTLFLDGRSCDLCVRADDAGRHGALATLSRCYLAYCECVRKSTNEKMMIAAAFTDGDSDFLMAARNGIFYDRLGRDWDATIMRVVEQPISIRQAFWSPYKRVAKMVESQIEKVASARDKAITDQAAAGVANASKKIETPATPPPAPAPTALQTSAKEAFDVAKFAGIFAAIGLAIGAIGGAVTAVAHGFMGLKLWQMPLAIGGALMLISGPAMLLAYMKLRQRNIGPILDANGWAVNARAKINVPFGASLTKIAELPDGASRSMEDPFVEHKSSKPAWIIIGLAVYIFLGMSYDNGNLNKWTDGIIGKPREVEEKKKDDKKDGKSGATNAAPAAAVATNAPAAQ